MLDRLFRSAPKWQSPKARQRIEALAALNPALEHDLWVLLRLAREHEVLIIVEEGAVGGFASHVLHFLARHGLLETGLKVRPLIMPDVFTDQAKPEAMVAEAGLDSTGIVRAVFAALGQGTAAIRA